MAWRAEEEGFGPEDFQQDGFQQEEFTPEDRAARQVRLARRVRRRALTDMLWLPAAVLAIALLGRTTHEALLLGMLASSAAILIFLHRRGRDLGALARADDWRAEAVKGRGISLSAWRAGDALPGWADRRDVA